MRTYTILISVVVHMAVVGALFVAPIFATAELPVLPRDLEFVLVTPTPPPASPQVRVRPEKSVVSPDAAPLSEPDAIAPEVSHAERLAVDESVALGAAGGVPGGSPVGDPPPLPPLLPAPAPVEPAPVGGLIRPPKRVVYVEPEYPRVARDARQSGVVILEAVIGEDGSVQDVKVLRSIPLLDAPATTAVKQWRFTPTLLNGQPIPIRMTVTVTFALQ